MNNVSNYTRWEILQKQSKSKEKNFLDCLREYCSSLGWQYSDVHNDVSTGVDVIINGHPFDCKVTNPNKKLTIFKRVNGRWYSPILNHFDIDYLYTIEYPERYLCFHLRKEDILKNMKGDLSDYSGDGNLNKCITLHDIMDYSQEEFEIRK